MLKALLKTLRCALALGAVGLFVSVATGARAETCTEAEVSALVESTSQRLKASANDSGLQLRERVHRLSELKGWTDVDAESKAMALIADPTTAELDERAGLLLAEFDRLSDAGAGGHSSCERLGDLKVVSAQLIEVTAERSARVAARLSLAIREAESKSAAGEPSPRPAPPAASPPLKPAISDPPGSTAAAPRLPAPPPAEKRVAAAVAPPPPLRPAPTAVAPPPPLPPPSAPSAPVASAPPVDPPPLPAGTNPQVAPSSSDLEFTVEEIRTAGRGLFGPISGELASVIEHAFASLGRPNGYIVGSDGGGALFAGLRYGKGVLVTKAKGERELHWQGPSVGGDFGFSGSNVLMLVYSLDDPERIYDRFVGVEGSAYVVGGVAMTVLKKKKIIIAPIRSGLGLRIGANVGYLKFTDGPSINPF